MAQALQDHEQYFDYTCNYICVSKNKVNESTKFCTECIRHMCSSCLETHQAVHATHRLVDPRASSQYRRNNTITEHCWKHPGKVSDLYCRRHDAVVCSACIPEHHSCGPASYIPEDVNSILHFREVQQTSNQLADLGRELDCLTVGDNDSHNSDRDSERTISDVRAYSAELIGIIKKLEDTAIQEVRATDKTKINDNHNTDEKCRQMKSDLNACLSNLLSADDNKPQQFVCTKNGQRLVTSAYQLLQSAYRTRAENQTCTFTIDSKIRTAVNGFRSLITVKGQASKAPSEMQPQTIKVQQPKQQDTKQSLKHVPKSLVHTPSTPRFTSIAKTGTTNILRILTVKKSKVSCKNDHLPTIWGCCLLSNRCLILSDNSNRALKLFDPTINTVTKTLTVPSKPRGVCCVSTQEIAVALNKNTIQFVNVIPSLTLSKSFDVDHKCSGISHKNDRLYITDENTKVYIHKMDGSLIQTITVPEMAYTIAVALSPGGELLYVAGDTGLACLEMSGRPIYTGGAGGGYCKGVCVDENGCVVVCDNWHHKVVQVGDDGEVLAVLLGSSDGLWGPWNVCMDKSNMKLYVTQDSNKDMTVASFAIQPSLTN